MVANLIGCGWGSVDPKLFDDAVETTNIFEPNDPFVDADPNDPIPQIIAILVHQVFRPFQLWWDYLQGNRCRKVFDNG